MNVEGYDNYLVFEDGVVMNVMTGKIVKSHKNDKGYLCITLCENYKKLRTRVNRLVAITYIENPENKPEVNHINRIRDDNRVENLEWNTHLENCQNKGIYKTNTSGEANITKTKWNTYVFRKTINSVVHCKSFKTLEEAVIYRDNYLSNL